jgi:4-amino-4-deoxy-L-arabinose transferase-like glycosyltransferase
VVWFGTLGVRPLYKSDESRYGEISREMVASGDWVTPRLNDFKYFEKPPLQYWTTAALFKVLGEHDWVARLWTALIGFAGIGLVLYAGNRLFAPPAGFYAAAVLAGSPLYVLMSQVNTLDMSVSVFLSAAVIAFLLGHMLLFWVACARCTSECIPPGISCRCCSPASGRGSCRSSPRCARAMIASCSS